MSSESRSGTGARTPAGARAAASSVPWLDRAEYPFAPHYFATAAGRVHYVDEGAGEPVVMVHGTPEWSFIYRRLIGCLAPRYRCVAADHLGFGLSDKPASWSYLPADHAANLEALIQHLDLQGITLVVHDFGGPIGLSYAIRHPEKVKRVVVMNSWMWSLRGDPAYERTRLFAGRLGRFLYERLGFSPRVMIPLAMGDRSKLTRHIHSQYLRAFPDAETRHGTWVLARELLGSSEWYDSLWQKRAYIRGLPALILWGMKDFAFGAKELARWREVFPDARVQTFPEIGHFVQEELGEELCPLVSEFLDAS
ncbi:MAG: alpha/beta fold hydrolase [Nitrososphaerales archaeon]